MGNSPSSLGRTSARTGRKSRLNLDVEPTIPEDPESPTTPTSVNKSSSSRTSLFLEGAEGDGRRITPANAVLMRQSEVSFYNSTLNVFVDTTLHEMQRAPVLKCIANMLLHEMEQDVVNLDIDVAEIFDERVNPVMEEETSCKEFPSIEDVVYYMDALFGVFALKAEQALIMLVYIDRVHSGGSQGGVPLTPWSWRRVVLGAMIIASKVWEDNAVWNADFENVNGLCSLSIDDINELERTCLFLMEFNVNVKANIYAQSYFTLRDFAISHNIEFHELDIEHTARSLEQTSSRWARKIRKEYSDRVGPDDLNDMRRAVSDSVYSKSRNSNGVLTIFTSRSKIFSDTVV